jgi:hypothetical protein
MTCKVQQSVAAVIHNRLGEPLLVVMINKIYILSLVNGMDQR